MREIACVASVSVGFSAHSRRFSLFGGAKIGASATWMEASQRKDSYGTILADLCRAVGVKVAQNLELFPDRMPVQFLCSKNLEFSGII